MPGPRDIDSAGPAFAALPATRITLGDGREWAAVHQAGRLATNRVPVICVAGYTRNMTDYAQFVPLFQAQLRTDWPVVLVDLRGHGRSSDRRRADDYVATNDALDLAAVASAIGAETAIFVGQGHGGHAIMALAAQRPMLLVGAVLIDAGPVTSPPGLVRLRTNLAQLDQVHGTSGLVTMRRRILSTGYPGLSPEALDRLADHTHFLDRDRAVPLFDTALISRLAGMAFDDVLLPQWPLFDVLKGVPLMLLRTQLTDQLPEAVLEEMMRRRPDAVSLEIGGQGSPALLDHAEEVGAIADFVRRVARVGERAAKRA